MLVKATGNASQLLPLTKDAFGAMREIARGIKPANPGSTGVLLHVSLEDGACCTAVSVSYMPSSTIRAMICFCKAYCWSTHENGNSPAHEPARLPAIVESATMPLRRSKVRTKAVPGLERRAREEGSNLVVPEANFLE